MAVVLRIGVGGPEGQKRDGGDLGEDLVAHAVVEEMDQTFEVEVLLGLQEGRGEVGLYWASCSEVVQEAFEEGVGRRATGFEREDKTQEEVQMA